ncbi:MAG: uL15m family ribosomal protein [Nanoarchaeota archaeon]|nr:uL15m family ribosomal protein [Nanoarchaeota archaeon]
MKTHKRKRTTRTRGGKTQGWGFRQKHKGHGNKGGFGMAGAGKRADHRRQLARDMAKPGKYFGKQGYTSKGTAKKKYDKINLRDIKLNYKENKIDLSGYKILGEGEGFKAEIKAKSATKSAIEKMEKAGGKLILSEQKEEEVEKEEIEEKIEELKEEVKEEKEKPKKVQAKKKEIVVEKKSVKKNSEK